MKWRSTSSAGINEQAVERRHSVMESLRILDESQSLNWEYDEQADVFYLSLGEPRAAVGVDAGDGLVLRYDESSSQIVGIAVIGLRERLRQGLEGNMEAGK
jgi:uncharacterized protein YuzE